MEGDVAVSQGTTIEKLRAKAVYTYTLLLGRPTISSRRWTMKLRLLSLPIAARSWAFTWRVVFLAMAAALAVSSVSLAQMEAPGEPVVIPGIEITGWGQVSEVPARFGRPVGTAAKVPAVLILHGSGGVDGRGAFYAKALQERGIATLEITMFPPGGRPQAGTKATMPHAAAALKWLAAQPNVNSQRLGVLGFSWGGTMSVLMASELVQERMGTGVPKPAAFVSLYPVCTNMTRFMADPERPFYIAHKRMSATSMLICVGTRDDTEEGERPCDGLVAMWPSAARERVTVRYVEGATHGFDHLRPAFQYYDNLAKGGRGAMVSIVPSPKDAAEVREAVVNFFVESLKP
jgi:uncharacterized protein